MSEAFQYVTLVASLPHLRPIFTQAHLPLSRYRLNQRLEMLNADHRAALTHVETLVGWAGVGDEPTDTVLMARFAAAERDLSEYPTLVDLLRLRIETHMLVGALRLRRDGADASSTSGWGQGRVARTIWANWTDPVFALSTPHGWLREAQGPVAQGDHIALERIVLQEVFGQIARASANHAFDFEAVALYVLRFQIVERWQRYDSDRARTRLSSLLDATLATAAAGIPAGLSISSQESLT